MAISEDDRYALHQALAETIGREQAATLMASIPPTGWAEVATKHDLSALRDDLLALEARLELRLSASEDRLRTEMAGLRVEIADRLRIQMQVMVASLAGFAAAVIAAVRL